MADVVQTRVFATWQAGLRDRRTAQKIATAIFRLRRGLGNIKRLSPSVSEVKIDYGPGYRLYFTRRGSELIILLCGGDKASQRRDIERAEEMAAEIE
jgi:putative addiction module killer protein